MSSYKTPVLDVNNLVPTKNLGTGTANSGTVLRGDQTWGLLPSAGNLVSAIVDFGIAAYAPEYDSAKVTLTGLTWVTLTSVIQAWVAMDSTADHDPDDIWVENLTAYVGNIVPGVGFDIIVRAPQNTWGKYKVYAKES